MPQSEAVVNNKNFIFLDMDKYLVEKLVLHGLLTKD